MPCRRTRRSSRRRSSWKRRSSLSPFKAHPPCHRPLDLMRNPLRLRLPRGGISSTTVRNRPIGFVQNENSPDRVRFRRARKSHVGRRATTVDAVGFTRLKIRNQSPADGCASLTNSPGPCAIHAIRRRDKEIPILKIFPGRRVAVLWQVLEATTLGGKRPIWAP